MRDREMSFKESLDDAGPLYALKIVPRALSDGMGGPALPLYALSSSCGLRARIQVCKRHDNRGPYRHMESKAECEM